MKEGKISNDLTEMDSSRLAFLKALLSEHLEDTVDLDSVEIENCDVSVIDGHASGLVSTFCRLEGDLEKLNQYYGKVGLTNKFTDLVIDIYAIMDKILARLSTKERIAYFERLKLMASIILDISLPQEEQNKSR